MHDEANYAPTLTDGFDGSAGVSLTAIAENSTNPEGETLESLITSSVFTDQKSLNQSTSGFSFGGIAVIENGVSLLDGAWQFKSSQGVWTTVPTTVSEDSPFVIPTARPFVSCLKQLLVAHPENCRCDFLMIV